MKIRNKQTGKVIEVMKGTIYPTVAYEEVLEDAPGVASQPSPELPEAAVEEPQPEAQAESEIAPMKPTKAELIAAAQAEGLNIDLNPKKHTVAQIEQAIEQARASQNTES